MAITDSERRENEDFENEVRRIARELWFEDRYSGSKIIDERERDGIFETEDFLNIIEATTSRRKDKIENDVNKIIDLVKKLSIKFQAKIVRGWIVTRDEPTPDQRDVVDKIKSKARINIMSFSQFQSKLVDSKEYLGLRDNYNFGSVQDPETGDKNPKVEYIELLISNNANNKIETLAEIVNGIMMGGKYVILGDFGAGKSMTLRHIYKGLKNAHVKNITKKFPVYINLRDHLGQTDPTELIERHARIIGFPKPLNLVRAWRAGYILLLLDGFDEVVSFSVQGIWRKLRDNRYRAMEAIRKIIREQPSDAGIVVTGRAHFFDNPSERHNALGLSPNFKELSLNEFTDKQIQDYFNKSGIAVVIPPWLPSRPLLVAYLGSRGLFSQGNQKKSGCEVETDPALGWDKILDKVSQREAEIEPGIDGSTIRRILERLSTKARHSSTGLGPLSLDTIIESFKEVCGHIPDDREMTLIQRLPGLGVHREEDATRSFIDEDFADSCRAGDIFRFIENPFDLEQVNVSSIEFPVGNLGISISANACDRMKFSQKKINAAISRSISITAEYLTADIMRVALENKIPIEQNVYIKDIFIPFIDLTENIGSISNTYFQDCFLKKVNIDAGVDPQKLPKFESCFIEELDGRISRNDLPPGMFDSKCIVETFSLTCETNTDLLDLKLPLGIRVLLTILKKLFQQRGSGRRENALYRGLDHEAQRFVPEILHLIQRECLAVKYRRGENIVWSPNRSQMGRVGRILSAPNSSKDRILKDAAGL